MEHSALPIRTLETGQKRCTALRMSTEYHSLFLAAIRHAEGVDRRSAQR